MWRSRPAAGSYRPPPRSPGSPAGTKATAVATPAPGTKITPDTKITLTFSRPVDKVLGKHLPPVSPRTAGTWHRLNSHTIQFVPEGYGYGLGANVRVSLPESVNLQGGQVKGSDPIGQWTVPDGSTLALQQLLAQLGYLPLTFTPSRAAPRATSPRRPRPRRRRSSIRRRARSAGATPTRRRS